MKFKIIRRNGTLIFKKAFFHSDTRKKKKWSFFKKVITFSGGFTGKKNMMYPPFLCNVQIHSFPTGKRHTFLSSTKNCSFLLKFNEDRFIIIFGKNRNSKGQYDERKKSKIIFLSLVLVIHGHTVILYSFGWCSLKNE